MTEQLVDKLSRKLQANICYLIILHAWL